MNKFAVFIAFFAILASAFAISQPATMIKADALECEACHVIVNAIDNWLAENTTVTYLDKKLESVCSLIKAAETACDAIVVAGLPQVINWIETNETPETACGPTQLKVCSSAF